uniref:uncharacterized protein LOC100186002 isoform X2 n=1 Tax=Ciona intestinalis TaxID=7719 RepID=UPI00089DABB1|nr:uncharacterized protein LOC100186002 isoform X2 [Ciona intestinalis]|eukprot:XP_018667042.1 uncharacterized protein LOC100186002 isoform X2 [Ciona intestinalis]
MNWKLILTVLIVGVIVSSDAWVGRTIVKGVKKVGHFINKGCTVYNKAYACVTGDQLKLLADKLKMIETSSSPKNDDGIMTAAKWLNTGCKVYRKMHGDMMPHQLRELMQSDFEAYERNLKQAETTLAKVLKADDARAMVENMDALIADSSVDLGEDEVEDGNSLSVDAELSQENLVDAELSHQDETDLMEELLKE